MLGTMNVLRDASNNVVYPVTIGDAVYVSDDTNLQERLEALDAHSSTYNIEPKRWGLTIGKPTKPYTVKDYNNAFMNIVGINNAIKWAKKKKMTKIVLPPFEYPICYPLEIEGVSDLIFSMGGAKLTNIFESAVRSPYNKNYVDDPLYMFWGTTFAIGKGITNFHIVGGQIQGDAYERDYTNPAEKEVEHSYGVSFREGCSYCSISNCEINGYMGDNINFTSGGISRRTYDGPTPLATVNIETGIVTSGTAGVTTTLVSNLKEIPLMENSVQRFRNFTLYGTGYTRNTALNNKEFDVLYYRSDGAYIGALQNMRTMGMVDVPVKATHYRLSFRDETDPLKDLAFFIDWGYMCHHNVVENCEIYDGHRGGMTLGGSYNVIQQNNFRMNGKPMNWMDGVPPFGDSTKYAVNQEDSYGDQNILRNNNVYGGFHGFLLRGYTVLVEGNTFSNLASAIVLYDQQFTVLRDNHFRNARITLFGASNMKPAIVNITDNVMLRGGVYIDGEGYETTIADNYFEDAELTIGKAQSFHDNRLAYSTAKNFTFPKQSKNNQFVGLSKTALVRLEISGGISKGDSFENLSLNAIEYADVKYRNCQMLNSNINGHASDSKIKIEDCEMDNTTLTGAGSFIIDKGKYVFTKQIDHVLAATTHELPELTVKNATFEFSNIANLTFANNLWGSAKFGKFDIINNSFEYTGTEIYPVFQLIAADRVSKSAVYGNKYKNVIMNLPVTDANNIKHDPEYAGPVKPTKGFFEKGFVFKNSDVTPTTNEGWVCTTAGFACNNAWVASTSYAKGAVIHTGGRVYRYTAAATSGATAPTHTSGTTASMEYLAPLAVFGKSANLVTA